MNTANIGKKIKEMRKKSGIRQQTLAYYLGIDQSLISKIESGERSITSDTLDKLSVLFCCPTDEFFSSSESVYPKFAFRTSDLSEDDLLALASVNRIILNQMLMNQILAINPEVNHTSEVR